MGDKEGTGFELSVDVQKFVDKLGVAETALDKLADKAQTTTKNIDSYFAGTNFPNLDSFIEKIKSAKNELGGMNITANNINLDSKAVEKFSGEISKLITNLTVVTDRVKDTQKSTAKPIPSKMFKTYEGDVISVNEKIKNFQILLAENRKAVSSDLKTENYERISTEIGRLVALRKTLQEESKKKIPLNIDLSSYTTSKNTIESVKANIKSLKSLLDKALKEEPSGTKDKNVRKITNELEKQKSALLKLEKIQNRAKTTAAVNAAKEAKSRASEVGQIKLAERALRNYYSAMSLSENSLASRIKKINALLSSTRALKKTQGEHNREVSDAIGTIKRLNRANQQAIKSGEQLSVGYKKTAGVISDLAKKIGALFAISTVKNFVMEIAKVRGEFEKQNRALQAILKNKYEADMLFSKITALAVRSPFQLRQLVTYTKQLAAYRIESDMLYDTTKKLADVSAGLGVDMNRLILAYGQVKAANYLRGTELRQFSEAGINILGELADKFSEVEGRAVSTGEVFERVSKRMVSFEDVADVFDRLTERGGLFYNMQEIQAETLAGKMSNLRDAYDIMLNEIGKQTQGAMVGTIDFLKVLMRNYETLEQIVGLLITAYIAYNGYLVINLFRTVELSAMNATLAKSYTGVQRAAIKATVAMKGVSNTMSGMSAKSGAIGVVIVALALIGKYLYDASKNSEELKNQFEKLSMETYRQRLEFNELSDSLSEYNKKVKGLKEEIGNTESEKKQLDIENKILELQTERSRVLVKLKRLHPEFAEGVDVLTLSESELAKEADKYNKILRDRVYINSVLSGIDTGWFGKGVVGQVEDLTDAYKEQNVAVSGINIARMNALKDIDLLQQKDKDLTDSQIKNLEKLKDGLSSVDLDEISLEGLFESFVYGDQELTTKLYREGVLRNLRGAVEAFEESAVDVKDAEKEFASSLTEVFSSAIAQAGFNKKDISKMTEEQIKEYNKSVKSVMSRIEAPLLQFNLDDPDVKEFVNSISQQFVGVDFFTEKQTRGLSLFAKNINEYVDGINKGLEKSTITLQRVGSTGTEKYFESLRNNVKDLKTQIDKFGKSDYRIREDIETLQQYDTTIVSTMSNEELRRKGMAAMKKVLNAQIAVLKRYGEEDEKASKKANKTALTQLKERISLLQKMNKEYEKLRKTESAETARAKVLATYQDAAKEFGITITDETQFDEQGTIDSISKLYNKAGKEGRKALEKALSPFILEIETNKAEKALANLSDKLDDAFADYEVTVEMEKLEVPTFMQSLFPDFKSTNIKQLREIVEGSKDLFIGTKGEKAYKEYLTKLEKLEAKSATDKAKEYIKYVKIMLSEREKIENKYATIFSEIEKSSLPDEAKALAKYRLDSEMRAKIAKSEFEDFKKSYDYQLVFDNLDTVATSSIRRIRDNMQALLDSKGSDLLPNDMKSLVDSIQKMDDKLAQRNPFKALADGIKEYQEAMKDLPEKQNLYNKSLWKSEDSQKRLLWAESKLEKAREQYGKDSKEYKKAESELAKAKLDSAKSSDNLAQAHDDLQKAMKKGGDATEKIQAGVQAINTYAQEAGEAVTMLMQAFGASDDAVSAVQDVMQAVEGLSDVASGIARMETDPVGGIIQTAKGVAKIATALNSIHDSKFDKEIRKQIRLVEKLEKKYEDLERAISKAYELDVIQGSFEEQKDIIESQNDAYLKMIAAERKKKDVSQKKIDEWEAAIKENNQRLEDLEMERLEQLGGINTKDAAEEFAEAWQDAFFETGDGLDALSDKFDDYMKNLILRQSMLKLGDKFMQPFIDSVNKAISDDSAGGARLTTAEMEEAMELGEKAAENLNRAYKQMYDEWGITPDTFGTTELSGLQKGIQGVTEETAGVIESYLNSLRYYATERNTEIRKIREIIEGQYGTGEDSPMLNEVRAIKALVTNIDNNLSSIVKSSASELGNGVRVFVG